MQTENKNVELRLVDVYDGEDVDFLEEPIDLSSENVHVIIIEVTKGQELISEGIIEGTTKQLFYNKDLEMMNDEMIAAVVDFKDTFTGDQKVLMDLCKEQVEDIEAEFNKIL